MHRTETLNFFRVSLGGKPGRARAARPPAPRPCTPVPPARRRAVAASAGTARTDDQGARSANIARLAGRDGRTLDLTLECSGAFPVFV